MLNQILKLAFVSSAALFLRKRWQRLSWCTAVILAAIYAHSEYLDYVAALPVGTREAAEVSEHLLMAFVLKNTAIVISILAAILPDLRRPRNRRGRGSRAAPVGGASPDVKDTVETEERSCGDGFDFVRHRRKLLTRTEQIMRDKPSG
ncbi:MAG: hypothetical protein OXI90_05315 [Gammaproteobacteria bacterium]|nr:hypothetical protein [Gammaproteobacteria bacterium]